MAFTIALLLAWIKIVMWLTSAYFSTQATASYRRRDIATGDKLMTRAAWLIWLPFPPPKKWRHS